MEPFPRAALLHETGMIQFSFDTIETYRKSIPEKMLMDDFGTASVFEFVSNDGVCYVWRKFFGMMFWSRRTGGNNPSTA